jgi:hypothetical protein
VRTLSILTAINSNATLKRSRNGKKPTGRIGRKEKRLSREFVNGAEEKKERIATTWLKEAGWFYITM